jgi:hypothetical protein
LSRAIGLHETEKSRSIENLSLVTDCLSAGAMDTHLPITASREVRKHRVIKVMYTDSTSSAIFYVSSGFQNIPTKESFRNVIPIW